MREYDQGGQEHGDVRKPQDKQDMSEPLWTTTLVFRDITPSLTATDLLRSLQDRLKRASRMSHRNISGALCIIEQLFDAQAVSRLYSRIQAWKTIHDTFTKPSEPAKYLSSLDIQEAVDLHLAINQQAGPIHHRHGFAAMMKQARVAACYDSLVSRLAENEPARKWLDTIVQPLNDLVSTKKRSHRRDAMLFILYVRGVNRAKPTDWKKSMSELSLQLSKRLCTQYNCATFISRRLDVVG